jgi:hypothetical protein
MKTIFVFSLLIFLGFVAINPVFAQPAPSDYIYAIATKGTNIFAGTWGGSIFVSSNNGTNWNAVNNGLPSFIPILSLTANGTNILAGTGGGYIPFH